MPTFNPDTRTKDHDYNAVYIRISHNSKTGCIKKDFSPVDRLNGLVLKRIFISGK